MGDGLLAQELSGGTYRWFLLARCDCSSHVIRSGSWKNDPSYVRPANRDHYDTNVRYPTHGFRVARSL